MLVCHLPDGRAVALSSAVADRVSCGVLVLDELAPRAFGPLKAAIDALETRMRSQYGGREPSAIEGLSEARDLYKSFGLDPSRHRPSSEALLRRLLKGQGLYRISNVVDACNLASLRFLLPIGMYDLAKVSGNVELGVGTAGHEYEGIRKGPVHLDGRLALFDECGPFGSPSSDSLRTSTGDATSALLVVVMAAAKYPRTAMTANLDVFFSIFAEHCGAREVFRALLGVRDDGPPQRMAL